MNNNFGLIMAGGIGSRFWPMSTPEFPKQFLDVLGIGKSLLRLTFERLQDLAPNNQIYILTNSIYKEIVLEQLPELTADQVLCEPERKNTAPCIAYAAAKIYSSNPEANLIITPSDHLIINSKRFNEIISTAVEVAEKEHRLVTLGIQPTRPDTGYGYIEFDNSDGVEAGRAYSVVQFREKPNLATASEFLAAGNFYWNAGIFVWKANVILEALKAFQPKLYDLFMADGSVFHTDSEEAFVAHCFAACEDISIDFAVMEHAKNISVVLADFDWSDLGTWGSLNEHLPKDDSNNALIGGQIHAFNCANLQVNVPNGKTVLLDGLNDYIVIDTADKLMVLKAENEQQLKNYLKEMGM
ncbi:MAG: hypothetical protein RL264_526 [Bacteroidota bacterium]|jgi:mannose-1-phosphate guanylyltransferase